MDENKRRYIAGTNLNSQKMLELFDPETRQALSEMERVGRPRAPAGGVPPGWDIQEVK
jgi:hypothetical protein